MRSILLLVLTSACVTAPSLRKNHGVKQSTHYSPADGLVLLPVDSSTDTITIGELTIGLEHAELGYRVVYETSDRTFLLEPGRYRVTSLRIGKRSAQLRSDVFTVESERVTVLPTLRVYGDEDDLWVYFEAGSSRGRDDYASLFNGTPWNDRPWRSNSWRPATIATQLTVHVLRDYYGGTGGGYSSSSYSRPRSTSSPNFCPPRSPHTPR
jgi:hypothetical protein